MTSLFVVALLILVVLGSVLGAAPVATARVAPTGRKLESGFVSKTTFSLDTNVNIYEIDGTPTGLDNGEPINTSTMWNVDYETLAPQGLNMPTSVQITGAYDPVAHGELETMVGTPQTITQRWSDGSTEAYFGYLRTVVYTPMTRNGMPIVTLTIQPTHYDRTNAVEAGPTITSVAGT